jgi:hypothetical protein
MVRPDITVPMVHPEILRISHEIPDTLASRDIPYGIS